MRLIDMKQLLSKSTSRPTTLMIISVVLPLLISSAEAQNRGKTVEIDITNKQYTPPPTTPKIPASFKDQGARLAVRAGDTIKICNKDVLVMKPFSLSPGNKFNEANGSVQDIGKDQYGMPTNPKGVGVGSNPGLRPGACMSYVAKNPGKDPIFLKLGDEIHARNKLYVVVLPANAPDQGQENTPHDCRRFLRPTEEYPVDAAGNIIDDWDDLGTTWTEEESDYTSIWTRQGTTKIFDALYTGPDGQKATTRNSVKIDGAMITILRLSSSDTQLCEYHGTLTGNTIIGTYKCPRSWAGERHWKATINCD